MSTKGHFVQNGLKFTLVWCAAIVLLVGCISGRAPRGPSGPDGSTSFDPAGLNPLVGDGRASEEQLAVANELLVETLKRLPDGPHDPKVSLSYDDKGLPSHNYFFFDAKLDRRLGFRGLEFDIHVDERDAVLIAVVQMDLSAAHRLVERGYTNWYKDNWSGAPAFHERTNPERDRYHVEVYRSARPLRPSPAMVNEIVAAVLRYAKNYDEVQR